MNHLLSILFLLICLVLSGCEDGEEVYSLNVSPSEVILTGPKQIFQVTGYSSNTSTSNLRQLSLPLTWHVKNPDMGQIVASEGCSAVYVRNEKKGVNIIYVKDQYGAEGFATVVQP